MDGHRFDELTRTFGKGISRRTVAKLALAGVFGAAGIRRQNAEAGHAASDLFKHLGKRCKNSAKCGPAGRCDAGLGVCVSIGCYIDGRYLLDGEVSHVNPCHVCHAGATSEEAATTPGFVDDGTACPPPSAEGPCVGFAATCQAGECVRDSRDGETCGEPGTCEVGICAGLTCEIQPAEDGTSCTPAPHSMLCRSDTSGTCGASGCEPEAAPDQQLSDDGFCRERFCVSGEVVPKNRPDGTPCGDASVCQAGECVPADPGGGGSGGCCITIEGQSECLDVAEGATDVANGRPCFVCDPSVSTTSWTAANPDVACGDADTPRSCCNGNCCTPTQQCVDFAFCFG